MASPDRMLDSVRQAAIRAEARFAALRALKATFKAWSTETKKSQKELAEILNADPAHISRVLAGCLRRRGKTSSKHIVGDCQGPFSQTTTTNKFNRYSEGRF